MIGFAGGRVSTRRAVVCSWTGFYYWLITGSGDRRFLVAAMILSGVAFYLTITADPAEAPIKLNRMQS
jgi:hypothetical protein